MDEVLELAAEERGSVDAGEDLSAALDMPMTTFTANLAADIRENLRKICTVEEPRRIEVIHLDAWVNQFMRESGFSAQIGYEETIRPLWEKAVLLAGNDLSFEVSFYEEEWNRIVIAQEALTLACNGTVAMI